MKDYYKALETVESATAAEIKTAFKKLAKKYHPDVNEGNPKAEERFKEISEAYEVLGKEKERQKYDHARSGRGSFNFGGFSHHGPFEDFFHSSSGGAQSNFINEILNSLNLGGSSHREKKESSGFDSIFGSRNNYGSPHNSGNSATLKVPLKTAITGGQMQVNGLPGGSQAITIPEGIKDGSVISVNTKNGSCRLKLTIEDEHPFKIKGANIETTIRVNLTQATIGSKIKLKDPRNQDFIVTIPAGSQHGDALRLRGLGLSGGDLIVKVEVTIPKNLTEDEKKCFIELAQKMNWRY